MCLSLLFFSSVAQSSSTLCDPIKRSTLDLPIHHQLPEFTQIHVHWVGEAIQSFYPLSSPSRPALNLSQHQGLFKWVSSSDQVVKILEFQLQHQSFQRTPRTDLLPNGLVGSPCSPRVSQESSPTAQVTYPWKMRAMVSNIPCAGCEYQMRLCMRKCPVRQKTLRKYSLLLLVNLQ